MSFEFVRVWVVKFCYNLAWILSKLLLFCPFFSIYLFFSIIYFDFFLLLKSFFFSSVFFQLKLMSLLKTRVVELCHNLSFKVLSQFDFLFLVDILVLVILYNFRFFIQKLLSHFFMTKIYYCLFLSSTKMFPWRENVILDFY